MTVLVRCIERMLSREEVFGFRLFMLNRMLRALVPFNAPHAVTIERLGKAGVRVRLPHRRSNLNHVGGLHACALATAAEFCSGVFLLSRLSFSRYRLLMKNIQVAYTKQGSEDGFAVCEPDPSWIEREVRAKLAESSELRVVMSVPIVTAGGTELCRAEVEWHLKEWSVVGRRVSD